MKLKWLKEIKELLKSTQFAKWWQEFTEAQNDYRESIERYEELLTQAHLMEFRSELAQKNAIDTLYKAGEYEDNAAQMLAEASELENKSYEAVGTFETKRIACTDLWHKVGASEHRLNEVERTVEELQESIKNEASKSKISDLKSEIKKPKSEIKKLKKEYNTIAKLFKKEIKSRDKMWEEVELIWSQSLELNLRMAELKMKGVQVRTRSEKLFKEADESHKKAVELKSEAEQAELRKEQIQKRIEELYSIASDRFQCVAEEEFLYWPQRENQKMVYCIPMFSDDTNYNMEIKALNIYQVDRIRGVEFVEPIKPEDAISDDEDTRIDEFFVRTRPEKSAA